MIVMFSPQLWERETVDVRSKRHVCKVMKINLTSLEVMGMMSLAAPSSWKSARRWRRFRLRQKSRSFHSFVLRQWNVVFSVKREPAAACLSFLIKCLRSNLHPGIVLSTAARCSKAWVILVASRFIYAAISASRQSRLSVPQNRV